MSECTFTHRVDLIVTLRDALSGNPIMDYQAVFSRDGVPFKLRASETDWLGVNTGRKDFLLGVDVRGYEKTEIRVKYESLDMRLPVVEIPLIPTQNIWSMPPLLTLEGSMKGIEELQAVSLREEDIYFISAGKDSQRISLYNPYRKSLRCHSYAVVDKERQEFEIVTILKTLPDDMVLLSHALKRKFKGNNPLVRPIYGMVLKEGKYLLRVPQSKDSVWIVRFVVEGKVYFQVVDFQKSALSLEKRNLKNTGKRG